MRSIGILARSEIRVLIFVWALIVAYVIGSDLRPVFSRLILLAFSGYLLSFGVYVLNSLSDLRGQNQLSKSTATSRKSKGD